MESSKSSSESPDQAEFRSDNKCAQCMQISYLQSEQVKWYPYFRGYTYTEQHKLHVALARRGQKVTDSNPTDPVACMPSTVTDICAWCRTSPWVPRSAPYYLTVSLLLARPDIAEAQIDAAGSGFPDPDAPAEWSGAGSPAHEVRIFDCV